MIIINTTTNPLVEIPTQLVDLTDYVKEETYTYNNNVLSDILESITEIPEYDDNTAAVEAGLAVGRFYRTGDNLKVVHS